MEKLLVFRIGKFKYPFGIERLVEAAPLNKLVDRPFRQSGLYQEPIPILAGCFMDLFLYQIIQR